MDWCSSCFFFQSMTVGFFVVAVMFVVQIKNLPIDTGFHFLYSTLVLSNDLNTVGCVLMFSVVH